MIVGFGRDFLFLVLIVSGWVVCFDLLLLYVGFQGWVCLRAVFVCLRFIIVLVVVLFVCCGGWFCRLYYVMIFGFRFVCLRLVCLVRRFLLVVVTCLA